MVYRSFHDVASSVPLRFRCNKNWWFGVPFMQVRRSLVRLVLIILSEFLFLATRPKDRRGHNNSLWHVAAVNCQRNYAQTTYRSIRRLQVPIQNPAESDTRVNRNHVHPGEDHPRIAGIRGDVKGSDLYSLFDKDNIVTYGDRNIHSEMAKGKHRVRLGGVGGHAVISSNRPSSSADPLDQLIMGSMSYTKTRDKIAAAEARRYHNRFSSSSRARGGGGLGDNIFLTETTTILVNRQPIRIPYPMPRSGLGPAKIVGGRTDNLNVRRSSGRHFLSEVPHQPYRRSSRNKLRRRSHGASKSSSYLRNKARSGELKPSHPLYPRYNPYY